MDSGEIANFSDSEILNRADEIGNSYNKASEHNSTSQFENNRYEREDSITPWTDEHEHPTPTLCQDSQDDLNVILPAFDTTDSAIGNDTYFLASLRGPGKPIENGEAPLLSEDNVRMNLSPEQVPPQEAGCAVDCMYYTLMCCECSIL
ncbi:uncharacterized protein [Rhodnius prolixus]|uniref:Uncharacterized protein n=1 Tax=Rhodnius prolixus TaxID=13249 RepID=T1I0H9_RHOPR